MKVFWYWVELLLLGVILFLGGAYLAHGQRMPQPVVAPGYPQMAHPSRCGGEGASCVVPDLRIQSPSGRIDIADVSDGGDVCSVYPSLRGCPAPAEPITKFYPGTITNADPMGVVIIPRNYDCDFAADHWVCIQQPDPDPQAELDNQE